MIFPDTGLPEKISFLKSTMEKAELIIIGAGSDLSSAAGLNFDDTIIFNNIFPGYNKCYGLKTINEALAYQFPEPENQYAFWIKLIFIVRYNFYVQKPYQDLYRIMKNKFLYIVTTNIDGLLIRAGFPPEIICSAHGDLAYFQCSRPCTAKIYSNKQWVMSKWSHIFADPLRFPVKYIPQCPECGSFLIPSIRYCDNFMDKPWFANYGRINKSIEACNGKNILLFELGAGLNSNESIQYPFEELARRKNITMVRLSLNDIHKFIFS